MSSLACRAPCSLGKRAVVTLLLVAAVHAERPAIGIDSPAALVELAGSSRSPTEKYLKDQLSMTQAELTIADRAERQRFFPHEGIPKDEGISRQDMDGFTEWQRAGAQVPEVGLSYAKLDEKANEVDASINKWAQKVQTGLEPKVDAAIVKSKDVDTLTEMELVTMNKINEERETFNTAMKERKVAHAKKFVHLMAHKWDYADMKNENQGQRDALMERLRAKELSPEQKVRELNKISDMTNAKVQRLLEFKDHDLHLHEGGVTTRMHDMEDDAFMAHVNELKEPEQIQTHDEVDSETD